LAIVGSVGVFEKVRKICIAMDGKCVAASLAITPKSPGRMLAPMVVDSRLEWNWTAVVVQPGAGCGCHRHWLRARGEDGCSSSPTTTRASLEQLAFGYPDGGELST
jgi:hypothetical protein